MKHLFLFAITLLVFAGCKKREEAKKPAMPAVTQTGGIYIVKLQSEDVIMNKRIVIE